MITNHLRIILLHFERSSSARLLAASGIALASSALLVACGQASAASRPVTFTVAGTVRDDIISVAAPAITPPTPDLTVGISASRLPTAPGLASAVLTDKTKPKASRGGSSAATAVTPASSASAGSRIAGRLASVRVRVGDTVKRGQIVAVFDDALLRLGVKKAQADAAAARATIAALDAKVADLKDKRSTARAARSKVRAGLATIATGKRKLAAAEGQLATGRAAAIAQQAKLQQAEAGLSAGIAALSKQIAQLERLPVPPTALIAQLKAKRAGLRAQLAQVEAGLTKIAAALRTIDAGEATIAANAAKLAAGETQAQAGLATVNSALSKLADAITKLGNARELAVAALPVRDRAVDTARTQAARAVILAPTDGVVTQAMHTGETAMVGSPVAKIRRAGPSRIDTWVTLEQLPLARVGVQALVTADSTAGHPLAAVVRTTASDYAFPPSTFPTTEIHMLRTVQVSLVLDAPGALLPAGTPVDVTFATAR